MRIKYLIVLIVGTMTLLACSKPGKPAGFDYGQTVNGKYINSFFDFEITMPDEWNVMTRQQNDRLMGKSDELVAGESNAVKEIADASKVTTTILFTAIQFPIDQVADLAFNPNIMIMAENLAKNENIKSAGEYLLFTRKTLEQQSLKRHYPDLAFRNINVNGADFSSMKVITYDTKTYVQDYYVRLINNFALTIILTYASENQRKILEQSLNTMKFDEHSGK